MRIALKPNFAVAYGNRGLAYLTLGDNEAALADSSRAIELDPNLAAVYFNRAFVYYILGDREAALADWQQAEALGFELPPEILEIRASLR